MTTADDRDPNYANRAVTAEFRTTPVGSAATSPTPHLLLLTTIGATTGIPSTSSYGPHRVAQP